MHTVVPEDAVAVGEPFTEEHGALRASIRRWAEDEIAPNAQAWEDDEWFPDEVFQRAGELGFLGLTYPTAYGGQGGDYWSTVVRAEEMARGRSGSVSMALAVQSDMATPPILKFGTEQHKQDYLVPAIAGERIACLGISEPEAGSDVANIRTRAEKVSDGWVINGSKIFITNGVRADFCTMVVRTSPPDEGDGLGWSGISLFLVDTDLDGFHVSRKLDKVGMRASDTAELSFTDLHVPDTALLGVEGQGFKQIMWELQGERLGVSVFGVAGARAVLDEAVRYAREREAFGKPIGDFQAVSHRLADMATEVEAVQALVYECCDLWNQGTYATEEVAMAKLAVGQLSSRVADVAVQTLGGAGLVEGSFISREWLGMRIGRIGGGSDEVQRQILARIMGIE